MAVSGPADPAGLISGNTWLLPAPLGDAADVTHGEELSSERTGVVATRARVPRGRAGQGGVFRDRSAQHEPLAGGPGGGKGRPSPRKALAPGCRKQLEEGRACGSTGRGSKGSKGRKPRLQPPPWKLPRERWKRAPGLNTQLTQNARMPPPMSGGHRTRWHGALGFRGGKCQQEAPRGRPGKTCSGEGARPTQRSPAVGWLLWEAGKAGGSPQPSLPTPQHLA